MPEKTEQPKQETTKHVKSVTDHQAIHDAALKKEKAIGESIKKLTSHDVALKQEAKK